MVSRKTTGEIKPILLARNLILNFDADTNSKHVRSAWGPLYYSVTDKVLVLIKKSSGAKSLISYKEKRYFFFISEDKKIPHDLVKNKLVSLEIPHLSLFILVSVFSFVFSKLIHLDSTFPFVLTNIQRFVIQTNIWYTDWYKL